MIDIYSTKNKIQFHLKGLSKFSTRMTTSVDVGLLTGLFFDLQGERVIQGGAERYIINLAHLIKQTYGLEMVVFQRSDGKTMWEQSFEGIRVVGLPVKRYQNLNYFFHKFVTCRRLAIYNQLDLAVPYCAPNSIAISHGIYWDNPNFSQKKKDKLVTKFLSGVFNVGSIVSVDTNTMNFFRTKADCRIINGKMHYVPNFVDTVHFKPEHHSHNESNITVTYPRRLYEARGYPLIVEAYKRISAKHKNVILNLVGEVHDDEVNASVEALKKQYPEKVFHRLSGFDEMQSAYLESDIVVVPTLYSEGTSLSLLEAMASGCCVIATNVGGLTDIIINDYNGVLCEPTVEGLHGALEDVISNPSKRELLSRRGRETAVTSFDKARWDKQWQKVLMPYLEDDK